MDTRRGGGGGREGRERSEAGDGGKTVDVGAMSQQQQAREERRQGAGNAPPMSRRSGPCSLLSSDQPLHSHSRSTLAWKQRSEREASQWMTSDRRWTGPDSDSRTWRSSALWARKIVLLLPLVAPLSSRRCSAARTCAHHWRTRSQRCCTCEQARRGRPADGRTDANEWRPASSPRCPPFPLVSVTSGREDARATHGERAVAAGPSSHCCWHCACMGWLCSSRSLFQRRLPPLSPPPRRSHPALPTFSPFPRPLSYALAVVSV